MKFSELVRFLEKNGFKIVKEKGSIRSDILTSGKLF